MDTAARVRAVLSGVVLVAGCSGPDSVRDDLSKATADALAAARAGQLAFTLLDRGDIGRAQAHTVFVDMTRELTTTQQSVLATRPAEPDQMPDRDQVLDAVHSAGLAVLSGRDCLRMRADCGPARDRLIAADEELSTVQRHLGGDT